MQNNHLNIETLEARTLFAGLNDAVELESIEAQPDAHECEGFVRDAGEVLSLAGSYMEVPGQMIQSVGEGIRDFFAEAPEYPHNGIYTGLSVDALELVGKSVSVIGLAPTVIGTAISYTGMLGEALGDDGYGDDFTVSNMIHDMGDSIASVGSAISQFGMDFADGQRFAPKYQDFMAAHDDHWMTIAGTSVGALISGVGFAAKLPGLAVHKAGGLTIKTCDFAHATSEVLGSAYASASGLYSYYFGSEAPVSV